MVCMLSEPRITLPVANQYAIILFPRIFAYIRSYLRIVRSLKMYGIARKYCTPFSRSNSISSSRYTHRTPLFTAASSCAFDCTDADILHSFPVLFFPRLFLFLSHNPLLLSGIAICIFSVSSLIPSLRSSFSACIGRNTFPSVWIFRRSNTNSVLPVFLICFSILFGSNGCFCAF